MGRQPREPRPGKTPPKRPQAKSQRPIKHVLMSGLRLEAKEADRCRRIFERHGECYTRPEYITLPGGLPRSMWCAWCKRRNVAQSR